MAASASDAHPYPIYNARFRFIAPLLDADGDLVTGAATPDSEISQDCGTFADATNEMTEIATGSGMYYLDLIATELDTKSTAVILKSATSGMKTTPVVLYPKRLPVIRTGTAQAGGASSITLDSSASAIDDYYVGCYVNVTNNSPSNALGQARLITAYVGSTKVATVEGTYGTNPSSASTFEVLATELWIFRFSDTRAFGGTALTQTGGRPEVNASHAAGTAWNSGAITANTLAADTITDAKVASDVTIASVTGAVGSVTGAVGSVTGAVGSVTGSVGSVASGGITAASFAANSITAAKLDPDVTTELQAGLATSSAVATLQTSVDDLPTNAELATALGTADDAVLTAIGDLPTNAELATALDALPTAAENADAVWDEALAGHLAAGSTGEALDAAGAAGTPPTPAEIADGILERSVAGGADGGRTVQDALRALRNKSAIVAGTLTVYAEDDSTPAWTAAVTTAPGDPLTSIDPA